MRMNPATRCATMGAGLLLVAATLAQTPQPNGDTRAAADLERFVGVFALPSGGTFEVRVVAGQLAVTGRGLQASARLAAGRWPPPGLGATLRRAEDLGVHRLEQLVQDRDVVFAEAFPSDALRVEVRQTFATLRQQLGAVDRVEYVGTETSRVPVSWFRLHGRERTVTVRASWDGLQRWTALEVDAGDAVPAAFRVHFRVLRRDLAVAKVGDAVLVLTVEGLGAGRVLVFEDATPGGDGLLECTWCGS